MLYKVAPGSMRKLLAYKFIIISFFIFFNFVPPVVGAADYGLGETGKHIGYNAQDTVYVVVNKVVSAFLGIIGILFFGLLMYGGIRWMLARGIEEHTTKAKEAITAAIIGMIIVVAAYALTSFIFKRLGV